MNDLAPAPIDVPWSAPAGFERGTPLHVGVVLTPPAVRRFSKRGLMRYHRHIAANFPQAPYLCHRTHYKVKANRGAIRTPPGGQRLPTGIVNAQGVFLPLWRGKDAHL